MCSYLPTKPHPALVYLFFPLLFWGSVAFGQLNANFSVDKNGGCSPLTVSFTNKTTGASPNATFSWDLGNGNTAAIPNPGAIYTTEKTYTVTLTVKDGAQSSVKTQQITVYNKPTVDFSANLAKGCLPLPVTFTSNSQPGSGSIAGYYWDFGDGSAQQGSGSSQQHTYGFTQTASVSLTVTNSYGCNNTLQKKDIVTIIPKLTAAFTADKTFLCRETDAVQFTNNSSGPGTLSYSWDFGDGNTATTKDPSYVFNKKGIYTVKLTANSSEGCTSTSTQTNYLNVASFKSDFDVPPLICKTGYVTFNSKSTPSPNSSVWTINGTTVSWYGSYLNYAFYTTGTQTITLTNTFGTCTDVATKQVSVKDIPDPRGFVMETKDSCGAPAKVNFTDTTATAVAWEWDFNYDWSRPSIDATQQAPSYTYTNDGLYNVLLKVTNADGCSMSTGKYFQPYKPSVTISYTNTGTPGGLTSCNALTLQFKANSSDPVLTYNWVFGDGGSSTDPEPVHIFTNPGSYQVRLDYITKNGCSGAAYFNSVTIYQKPKLDFSIGNTQVCGNTPALFTGTVTPSQGTGSLWWQWDFGDGSYVGYTGPVMQHTFLQEGLYTVKAIVNNGYCSDTVIKTNYVKVVPPFVQISTITNTCDDTRGEIVFGNTCKDATSLIWDFGDGTAPVSTPGTQTTISHVYTKTGSYVVYLTGINGQCTVKDFKGAQVLLKQHPVLSADKTEVCMESSLKAKITNYEMNPRISAGIPHYTVQFQYGDGSNFNGAVFPNYWYWTNSFEGDVGNFEKNKQGLRVITTSNAFGCKDTSNVIPLKIKGDAAAGFEIVTNNVCYKNAIVLKDTSKSFSSTIQSWMWNFGDGQSSTQSGTVSHTYANPGNYYVSLQVTDASGCSSGTTSYSHSVQVNGPKAAFSPSGNNVPLNTTIYFYNNTNDYGSSNTTYQWLVNNTPFSSVYGPSYTFTQPGTYTVKLIATNPVTNCSSEYTQEIVVKNFNAGFNFSKTIITANSCPPVLVRFNNTSSNFTSIKWDFGDGFTLENVNYPSHIYEKPGKYYITLYVYGPGGLKDQYLDSLNIPQPVAAVQTSSIEGCIGHTVTLNATNRSAGAYVWDFGDGSIQQTTDSFAIHQYTVPGKYAPALLLKDGATGCMGSASLPGNITIRPDPVVQITLDKPLVCLGDAVALQASGGDRYAWSPAAGLSNAAIASPLASPTTTTTYTVQVSDDIGCKNTGAVTITVVQPVLVSVTGNKTICKGEQAPLLASGADLYTWINTTTGLNNTTIANPVSQPETNTQYTVVGSDAHHCFTDTASIDIQVFPLPTVSAGPDLDVWAGNAAQLQATGSSDVIAWNWTPSTYLNCTTCPGPVSKAEAETMYTITVKNQYGCKAYDSVLVKILCNEERVAIPNGFTPNNDGYNDVFMIKGISIVNHLVIFNRWGQKIFERSNFIAGDRSQCWDGTINGYPAAEGTYVYLAELQCPTGGRFTRKGTITLLR